MVVIATYYYTILHQCYYLIKSKIKIVITATSVSLNIVSNYL